jgi:hypothetical protein
MAMSAAAISAIALMPSASWASFRFSLISFSSAGLFGSSSIGYLKIRGARHRTAAFVRAYHALNRQRGIFGPDRAEKRPFSAEFGNRGEAWLVTRDRIRPAAHASNQASGQNVTPAFTI